MWLSLRAARGVLVAVGAIFVASGLVVSALVAARAIPAGFGWHGRVFVGLGAAGAAAAGLGLRSGRRWPAALAFLLYVPWTLLGLIGDIRQRLWPLVAGEAAGLVLVLWASASIARAIARRRG